MINSIIVSHRRRVKFGKKRLILGRSSWLRLTRLCRFFLEWDAAFPARQSQSKKFAINHRGHLLRKHVKIYYPCFGAMAGGDCDRF